MQKHNKMLVQTCYKTKLGNPREDDDFFLAIDYPT